MAHLHHYYDETIKKIDATNMGCGLTCKQKQDTLKDIQDSFEDESSKKMADVTSSSDRISKHVNNFDVKQIEDQVSSNKFKFLFFINLYEAI